MGIITGHGQVVRTQRAGDAFDLPALTIAAHGSLCIQQGCALHTGQLQRPCGCKPGHAAARNHHRSAVHYGRRRQIQPLRQALPEGAQAVAALKRRAGKAAWQIIKLGGHRLAARQTQGRSTRPLQRLAAIDGKPRHQCSTLPHSRS